MSELGSAHPPLFDRGPGRLVMLLFYLLCGFSLLIVDIRFNSVQVFIRPFLSFAVDPLQRFAQLPGRGISSLSAFFYDFRNFEAEKHKLELEKLGLAEQHSKTLYLEAENNRLRRLMQIPPLPQRTIQIASILSVQRNTQTQKILIDHGLQYHVQNGQPVMDDQGLIGQVTRSLPLSSEVTLITDTNQAIPIQIVRTGLRSVVFGLGDGTLELRYIPLNADVREGDILVTSGLDGVYPTGLNVGKIAHIDHQSSHAFGRIICTPIGGVENYSQVALLSLPENVDPQQAQSVAAFSDKAKLQNHVNNIVNSSDKRKNKKNANANAATPNAANATANTNATPSTNAAKPKPTN